MDESLAPPIWQGIILSLGVYCLSVLFHAILPGANVIGYACSDESNSRLSYKLNGLLVTIISLALFITIPILFLKDDESRNQIESSNMRSALVKSAFSYHRHFLGLVVGGNIWGILLSIFFYRRGFRWCRKHDHVDQEPLRCSTDERNHPPKGAAHRKRSLLGLPAFYRGIGEFNPRISLLCQGVDVKMWLYLAGTIMLQFQVVTMAAAHIVCNEYHMSRAVAISSLAWTWFCMDYLSDEHIHLYTYDVFAERIGFKLGWGCLSIYPFFYPLGQSVLVRKIPDQDDLSWSTTLGVTSLFLFGWSLTRGANYQKYMFKKYPTQESILGGLIRQQVMTIPLRVKSNDTSQQRSLLVSGFWGLARHINYLGEIMQGFALGLPGLIITQSPVSMVYFCFITAILIPRQVDDDKLCRAKYGDQAWDAYTQLVPYKIIPGIY